MPKSKGPEPLKPGQPAPLSGIYDIVGPRGGSTGGERTIVQGEPMPPTPKPGQGYIMDRPANNGSGGKK